MRAQEPAASGHDVSAARPARRVLIVHNRYQIAGGEDAAVEREAAALARTGLDVDVLLLSNDEIRTARDSLRVAIEAPHARRGIARVMAAVRRDRPDVVHVHNSFPLVSPGVHRAVRRTGVATVQTLHNFRVTCANGSLVRDGRPCEECVTGSPYRAVLHGCYRHSRLGSLAVARLIAMHRRRRTWSTDVDRFIALSSFARSRFVAAGLPAARIRVKANGLDDPCLDRAQPRTGLLYVGRLSEEKGVRILAAAARETGLPIEVIGEGPLAAELAGIEGLTLRGACDRETVAAAMARAAALLVPSICYENMPMVIAEAFAMGTPVVASDIGSLAGIVADAVTGLHVTPGDPADLARAGRWIFAHPAEARRLGAAARAVFEREWSQDKTTADLLSIYAEAMISRAHGEAH